MTNMSPAQQRHIRAAVVRRKGGPFVIETLAIEEPRVDEVLVRIVATGMCHTDLVIRDQVYPVPLPIVLGHEGGGVVERVGNAVRKVGARRSCRVELHVVRALPPMCGWPAGLLREGPSAVLRRDSRGRQHRDAG